MHKKIYLPTDFRKCKFYVVSQVNVFLCGGRKKRLVTLAEILWTLPNVGRANNITWRLIV